MSKIRPNVLKPIADAIDRRLNIEEKEALIAGLLQSMLRNSGNDAYFAKGENPSFLVVAALGSRAKELYDINGRWVENGFQS